MEQIGTVCAVATGGDHAQIATAFAKQLHHLARRDMIAFVTILDFF
jgi:hypothetical protein